MLDVHDERRVPLDPEPLPARVLEAQQIEAIRRDCADAGLNAHQTQRVLARARRSLRVQKSTGNALVAVLERGKATQVSSFTLLDGLQAAFRALFEGRSTAMAVFEGNKAMRPQGPARGADGGAA